MFTNIVVVCARSSLDLGTAPDGSCMREEAQEGVTGEREGEEKERNHRMSTYMHTYTHIHAHTCIHVICTHAHAHTHNRSKKRFLSASGAVQARSRIVVISVMPRRCLIETFEPETV